MVKVTESSPLEEVDPSSREGSAGQASFESRSAEAEPGPPRDSPTLRLLRLIVPPLAVIGAVGALELFRRRFERGRLFLPSRYPDGSWDPSSEGVAHEDVFFPSTDHTRLHGWFFEHPAATTTLIYCHGNRGSIADRIGIFRQLLRTKVNVFAFDYRGYGRSTGAPTERGLFADVRAAIDLMIERGHEVESLVLFGHSLGGAVAIDGAWHRPVGGLVVQSSFTQLKDMARHRYPDLPMHWITSNNFRSLDKVRQLRLPKLFIHGTDDQVVPYAQGEILFEAAAAPKSFLSIPDAGHHDVPDKGGRRYFQRLSRFFRRLEKYRQAEA